MTHDRQFSINAEPITGEKNTRIHIDVFGGGEYQIEVRGKLVRFEWSEQFGPMPINQDGSECLSVGPRHGFWRAASLWNLQGRRIENGKAIWHEPKQPVLIRRGRELVVAEDGESGWDW